MLCNFVDHLKETLVVIFDSISLLLQLCLVVWKPSLVSAQLLICLLTLSCPSRKSGKTYLVIFLKAAICFWFDLLPTHHWCEASLPAASLPSSLLSNNLCPGNDIIIPS